MLLISCSTPNKPQNTFTDWTLDTNNSQLSFISTKNKTISETHQLTFKDGSINSGAFVDLIIDLNQVETHIEIRNQRVKDLLFQTDRYPTARIKAQLPENLVLGTTMDIRFELDLHGITKELSVPVMAQMVDEKLTVINYQPITIQAKDFDLDAGLNQLTQVAKLQAISYEVPVDFKLVFNKISTTN